MSVTAPPDVSEQPPVLRRAAYDEPVRGSAWYAELDGVELDATLETLALAGLSLTRPGGATVRTLSPIGEPIEVSVEAFRELARTNEELLFKVWDTQGTDVYMCRERVGATVLEQIELTMLEHDGRLRIASALYERFLDASTRTRAFVAVDWLPIAERAIDWRTFLAGRTSYAGTPPEVLGVPPSHTHHLRLALDGCRTYDVHGHLLVMRERATRLPVDVVEVEVLTEIEISSQPGPARATDVQELDTRFAAARSACEDGASTTDFEPQLATLLGFVLRHPELRAQASQRFVRELRERRGSCDLVGYCMHALRWPEVKAAARVEQAASEDWRVKSAIAHVVASFDDDWEDADLYQRWRREG